MKFLIDEQLPVILSTWLLSKGFDAVHIHTLSTNISLSDKEIRHWSLREKRIVITKDEDFFNSFIFQLLDLFRANINHIIELIEQHDVIEINKDYIKVWF